MARSKKVGYTYYGKGGAKHTGVTNDPARRRSEHNLKTGGNGFLKVKTGWMTKATPRLGTRPKQHQGLLADAVDSHDSSQATVGYSGTPLPAKLGIKAGTRLLVLDAPAEFDATLGELPPGVGSASTRRPDPVEILIAFYTGRAELSATFPVRARRLIPAGALWIAWPKRSSGVPTDLTGDVLREVCLPTGMVDNKVCAIDSTWSGLRFVVRKEHRAAL